MYTHVIGHVIDDVTTCIIFGHFVNYDSIYLYWGGIRENISAAVLGTCCPCCSSVSAYLEDKDETSKIIIDKIIPITL